MSHEKKSLSYNGTTIVIEDDVNFQGAIKIPYYTSTGEGNIRYNTSVNKIEFYSTSVGTWVQAGGASFPEIPSAASRGEAAMFNLYGTAFGSTGAANNSTDIVSGTAFIKLDDTVRWFSPIGGAYKVGTNIYPSCNWAGISNTRTAHLSGVTNSYDMCLEILFNRTQPHESGDYNLVAVPIVSGGGIGIRNTINSYISAMQLYLNNTWVAISNSLSLATIDPMLIHINQYLDSGSTVIQDLWFNGLKIFTTSFAFTTSTSNLYIGGGLAMQRCNHFALWTSTSLTENEIKSACRTINPNHCWFE